MFLARKIALAKWSTRPNLVEGEISADAVTGDLRTKGDTLSFWQCHTESNDDVEEVALAIAAAGDRIDKLDIVWLSEDEMQADGQTLKSRQGRTPVAELAERHVDVCKLDYIRLGEIARRVVAAIDDERCRRFTKKKVKALLVTAAGKDRIDLEQLADGVKEEIVG